MTESEIKRLRRHISALEEENARLRMAAPAAADEHYRAILESAVDFAIIGMNRDGRVTDWNTGAERIFGWSAEEMRGELAEQIFTPEDRAEGRLGIEMRHALKTGRASNDRWHLRSDGSRFWARGEMMLLQADDGTYLGYIKILRDRTEQERAEEALRASEERLRVAQRVGGVGTFEWYPDSGTLDVSDEYRRVWGLAPEVEVTTGLLVGLIHPDDRALSGPARMQPGENPLEYAEYRITRPDTGEERWIARRGEVVPAGDGVPRRFLGVAFDITERKRTEAALAESEAHFRATFEQAAVGVAHVGLDGHWLRVNARLCTMLGYSEAELLARTFQETTHPDDLAANLVHIRQLVSSEVPSISFEKRYVRGDGGTVSAAIATVLRRDPVSGAPLHFISVFQDITDRKRAEDALRESEEQLRLATEAAEIGLWDVDTRTDSLFWPPRVKAMFGISPDVPVSIADFYAGLHPDDRERVSAAFAAALDPARRALYDVEYRTIGKEDGVQRWVAAKGRGLFGADGACLRILGTAIDITLRKRAGTALVEAQGLNTAILHSSRDCIVVLDLDGRTQFVSPGGIEAMEITDVEAILNLSWLRVWQGADYEAAHAAVAQARAGGTGRFQGFCPTHKGTPKWWDVVITPLFGSDGRPDRLVSSGRDITETRHAEAALQVLNATLEQQVEERTRERDRAWQLSQDLLFVAEMDGTLAAVNAAWTALLGWEALELVGSPFEAFTHPDDLEATLAAFVGIFEAPLTEPYEYRLRHKDGTYRWFAWTGAFEDGKVYASGRHTTAEHEQAAALAVAEEQLRQSQKMEAVGQLTGGLAHDFNNLLTGIAGSLELMQARLSQGRTGDLDRYILAAQGASKRAAALTHRLLAFSRRQTLDPKLTKVDGLVTGMEDLIRRTMGPAVEVEVVGTAGSWPALVDPNQLENALLNLCINARDAMPDGGRLTIETANKWLDERAARERELPPGQYLSLCVTDTGTGMAPEVIQRAFDPFFTTKPLGMGTGLGLSMVYGFARQSGGQVRIYSELGNGTTMCLYLPRYLGQDDDASMELPGAPRAEQGETVLVVDDEPTVRMLVTDVLDTLGYTAIEAADGAAGLKVLQSDLRIDLLVTDVGLPGGMNGRQVADAGRAARPGLKVLFITGYAENAVVGNGHLDPGMQVLTKPFTIEALANRIKDLIAGK